MTRLRRNGPPSEVRVVEAFAMLFEMTSWRIRCAVRPLAAVLMLENMPMHYPLTTRLTRWNCWFTEFVIIE